MSVAVQVWYFALYVLAVARLTKVVNSDYITDPIRVWAENRARYHEAITIELPKAAKHHDLWMRVWDKAAYLLECPWCVSPWLGLPLAYLYVRLVGWPVWAVIPVALAASYLTGVLAPLTETDDSAQKVELPSKDVADER